MLPDRLLFFAFAPDIPCDSDDCPADGNRDRPEADLEACAEWVAVAFSQYGPGANPVDVGDGVVCVAIDGCARIKGAQADNPAANREAAQQEVKLLPPSAGSGGLLEAALDLRVLALLLIAAGVMGAVTMGFGVAVNRRLF